jgi:hypothetical protein
MTLLGKNILLIKNFHSYTRYKEGNSFLQVKATTTVQKSMNEVEKVILRVYPINEKTPTDQKDGMIEKQFFIQMTKIQVFQSYIIWS